MQQLELVLAQPADPAVSYDIAFMHRSLTIAGLPVRRPPEHDGQTASFHRKGAGFSLRLITPNLDIPDANISIPIGVPYGAKARLLVLWLASQARQSSQNNSRFVEIGPIKQWLNEIGIGTAGDAINQAKEQLIKLSHTMFNVTVRTSDDEGEDILAFRNDLFVEQGAIATEDMLHYRDRRLDKVRWPKGIVVPENTWKRFERDVVPIPMERLRPIAHSATAIDIFLYLSYRLPMIAEGKPELMTWRQLAAQFGPARHLAPSRFKDHYTGAIQAALKAYPEARIDEHTDGLVLHHSDPASLTRAFIASSALASSKPKHVRNRFTPRRADA